MTLIRPDFHLQPLSNYCKHISGQDTRKVPVDD